MFCGVAVCVCTGVLRMTAARAAVVVRVSMYIHCCASARTCGIALPPPPGPTRNASHAQLRKQAAITATRVPKRLRLRATAGLPHRRATSASRDEHKNSKVPPADACDALGGGALPSTLASDSSCLSSLSSSPPLSSTIVQPSDGPLCKRRRCRRARCTTPTTVPTFASNSTQHDGGTQLLPFARDSWLLERRGHAAVRAPPGSTVAAAPAASPPARDTSARRERLAASATPAAAPRHTTAACVVRRGR